MTLDFKGFLFTGLMATQCIRDLELKGQLQPPVEPRNTQEEDVMLAAVSRDIRAGSHAMQRNYRLVFVFENVLRELISSRLIEVKGTDWFSECAPKNMRQKVAQRQKSEQTNAWHPGIDSEDIRYLDLSDLYQLIESTWQHFEDCFPSRAWIETRITEVNRSRNVIAHANRLTGEESKRIEMYLRDLLKQVG